MSRADRNLDIYNAPEIVGTYAARAGLQPCEAHAFDKYISPGAAILDIGVGGGRTAPYLSAKASRYVGIDYSQGMVEACRKKFPELSVFCESACDLGRFQSASFDVAVFSFNGLAYIGSDRERLQALREIARVLKPGGHFIFSLPNAGALGVWPYLRGANPIGKVWRVARAAGRTIALASRRLRSPIFARGSGYDMDPSHGGLWTFSATPETIHPEVEAAGLIVIEVLNGYYPLTLSRFFIPWYYYVLTKP